MNLDATDIRDVFALIDQLRSVGSQPSLWKPCMLCNLCRMFHARLGICMESVVGGGPQTARRDAPPAIVAALPGSGFLQSGTSAAERRGEALSPQGAGAKFIADPFCLHGQSSDEHLGFEVIRGRCGYVLCSHRHFVSIRRRQRIFLMRNSHGAAFTRSDQTLLKIFHAELARVITRDDRSGLPTGVVLPPTLSPRLAQTLELLAAGLSEKQVAAKLGCRPNTTHGYIKELHRRFNVNSRAELLAARARIDSQYAGRLQF